MPDPDLSQYIETHDVTIRIIIKQNRKTILPAFLMHIYVLSIIMIVELFLLIHDREESFMDYSTLVQEAFTARKTAYVPYSNFAVGAALLTKNGKVFHGCNIENASYTPTNCAERTAIFKAVSEGEKDFMAIAVCGGYEENSQFCYPCGVCRQVLMEFCDPDEFVVIVAKSLNEYKEYRLKELLPFGFGPHDLECNG